MDTCNFIGRSDIQEMIRLAVTNNTVAHAYLFYGPQGSGKQTVADYFAAALNCLQGDGRPCCVCSACRKAAEHIHPDICHIAPDGKSLKIDQIRQIRKNASLKAQEGRYQVFILAGVDQMTAEAANSLLKFLEEPPGHTVFMLLSENPAGLPPTVVSRCQPVMLRRLKDEEINRILERAATLSADEKERIARLAGGIPGRALSLAKEDGAFQEAADALSELTGTAAISALAGMWAEKENLADFLDNLLTVLRDLLVWKTVGEKRLLFWDDAPALSGEPTMRWTAAAAMEAILAILALQNDMQSPINVRLALERALRRIKEGLDANGSGNPL